jgi:hypothetical protein
VWTLRHQSRRIVPPELPQDRMRLEQFSRNKCCYYCGAPPPSSREHAPVRAMFEAFDCDSVTVPSCDKHNTVKNLDDRAIVAFLIKGLFSGLRYRTLSENVMKAIQQAEPSLRSAKEATLRPWTADMRGELDTLLAHLDRGVDIRAWMRQLTAGMVWSATGHYDPRISWGEAVAWSPHWQPSSSSDPLSIEQAALKIKESRSIEAQLSTAVRHWWRGWSSSPKSYPPDIYSFEVGFPSSMELLQPRKEAQIIFKHRFYANFTWYVEFTASADTATVIVDALKAVQSQET